jgi:hypothetical protein
MVEVLSAKTGTSVEQVRATTLTAYENILYERHNRFGPTPWIMPIGVYHRKRRQFGLQYCPRCLAEDEDPYYRRKWRLAFIVICEKHCIILYDRCPNCNEPVNFHRDEMGDHRKFVAVSLTLCHICRFDLRKINNELTADATLAECRFTKLLLQAVADGFIQVNESVVTYSHLFFVGFRQLMKILAMHDRRIVKLHQAISKEYSVEIYTPSASKSIDIQELRVEERRQLLGLACCLLDEWPHRFIELSIKFKVWSSLWLRHLEPAVKGRDMIAPFWFCSVVHEHLYRTRYCPSDEEINSVIRYLERRGDVINKSSVARLLGIAVLRKKGLH